MANEITATGYDDDFARWALHQAKLLREKRFHELDLANLIEEVESIASTEKREIKYHLAPLLALLIRWQCFEGWRCENWKALIGEHRTWIEGVLKDSPSLTLAIPRLIERSWSGARLDVHKSSGINLDLIPDTCPWTAEQVLSIEDTFLPA